MLALKVEGENIKTFMNELLKGVLFDSFELRSVVISTYARFEISEEKTDSKSGASKRRICGWKEVKPFVFSVLKGRERPTFMKLVFSYETHRTEEITENAAALFLNITFDGTKIYITTGWAQKGFSLDKTPEVLWDAHVESFLRNASVNFVSEL